MGRQGEQRRLVEADAAAGGEVLRLQLLAGFIWVKNGGCYNLLPFLHGSK
jgi:hypothetical protein